MAFRRGQPALICLLASLAASVPGGEPEWQKAVKTALEDYYGLTKKALFGDRMSYGKTLLVRTSGIMGDPDDGTYIPQIAVVRDGKVMGEGGRSAGTGRPFSVGEAVYLTRVDPDSCGSEDCLNVRFVTAEPQDILVKGTTRRLRYRSQLRFKFPKGFLAASSTKDIVAAIAPVLITEDDAKAAPPAKTIALGQTPDEVKAILGEPEKVVDLGPKKIFVYKDMKVVFVDGKVNDVQ